MLATYNIGDVFTEEVVEQLEALREGKESVNAVARRLMYERLEQLQEKQASSAPDA